MKKLPSFLPGLSTKLHGSQRRSKREALQKLRQDALASFPTDLGTFFHDILPADWLAGIASDAQMAIENARDVYCRRNEGISIWVVESVHIHASTEDAAAFFDPANDKVYRHPTFYEIPEGVKNL